MGFLRNDRLIIGYDLGNEFSQISYAVSDSGGVETLSQVAGAQIYNIPTALCKRNGVNQWFYGKEAFRRAGEQEGILVENLVELALNGEPVLIEEGTYDPVALLALFFKRSLGMLSQIAASEKIGALMVTCERLDHRMLEVLNQMVTGLRLKADHILFQSYPESFYSYMLRQPGELWLNQSVLLDYRRDRIRMYAMEKNRKTTPMVVFIEEGEADFPALPGSGEELSEEAGMQLDRGLLELAQGYFNGRNISSVFLIGDGFSENWMKESLKYLCRGRRVFQGNNLFSKGACCGMQERLKPSDAGREHIFLGNDKLKANIGMDILRQGETSYLALLDAGVNWYEAEAEVELYLQEGNRVALTVRPLIGGDAGTEEIILEGLPEGISRIRAHFYLEKENEMTAEFEDLGFGEFRASSGLSWKKTIELY